MTAEQNKDQHQNKVLNGVTVLVVDDELLIGLDTEWILQQAGATVFGPFTTLSSSLNAMEHETPQFAVVDFRLGKHETTTSLIEILTERGVPTILYSGQFGLDALPENCRFLSKPASEEALIQAVQQFL